MEAELNGAPRTEPWAEGAPVVWRSRPQGDVGYVFACRVLIDDTQMAAVVQPTGAPVAHRVTQRGGPRGRSSLPGTWTGERITEVWGGPTMVRLHPVGRDYSVIREWDPTSDSFTGWYVNLETSWVRTAVGFDSRDNILDLVVDDECLHWHLKDEDELAFAVEVGTMTAVDADGVRRAAAIASDAIDRKAWPFQEETWDFLRPTDVSVVAMPIGWEVP